MFRLGIFLALLTVSSVSAFAQLSEGNNFKLALGDHRGQLRWSAEGFKVIQTSAKPNGREIGVRATDEASRLTLLGFLFVVPGQAHLSSAACRDGAIEPEKKGNSTLKVLKTAEVARSGSAPISIISYTATGGDGNTVYSVRGFISSGDLCGDLEFYSKSTISPEDVDLKKVFTSYHLDDSYVPKFQDALFYAQTLYQAGMYKGAAPMFEVALAKLNESPGPDSRTMRRLVTDQAGMAYGIAGDTSRARSIFEKGVVADPDYPLYYYNLACADAADKNLVGARTNLQKAFDRRLNILPGEHMPDPTTDDSFLPYRDNEQFWTFLVSLRSNP
jgi:hypothetical protein